MALSLSLDRQHTRHGVRQRWWDITFDSSYPSGGESLTPSDLGMKAKVNHLQAQSQSGYVFEYDYSNETLQAFNTGDPSGTLSGGGTTGNVIDDDSAASNGTTLHVHVDEVSESGQFRGHIESTTAGNANTYAAISNGGPTLLIVDDDAAGSGGAQIYFDEDASNADERWLADIGVPGDADVFVELSTGEFIRIKDDGSAASNGVALHVDDDATNDYEKLLFVSPTDTDGTFETDDTAGANYSTLSFAGGGEAVLNEVDAATNLASVTTRVYAVGI